MSLLWVAAGCALVDGLADDGSDPESSASVQEETAGPSPAVRRNAPERPDPGTPVFNHPAHLRKGLECVDCHAGAEDAGEPLLPPDLEFCMECHEDEDEGKPPERQVTAFVPSPEAPPAWRRRDVLDDESKFRHPVHVAADLECGVCHPWIEDAAVPQPDADWMSMESCIACHEDRGAPAECETCHSVRSRTWKPESHSDRWAVRHGPVSQQAVPATQSDDCALCHEEQAFCSDCHTSLRPRDHLTGWRQGPGHGFASHMQPERCSFCHDRNTCTECHNTRAPRDHVQAWRRGGGHGLAAAMNRERCQTCHEVHSCRACHDNARPRSHRGGWGGRRSRHCITCHEPLRAGDASGCGACHTGTPSHDAAPRMPRDHKPDWQCILCHADLRHPDDGRSCLRCHR